MKISKAKFLLYFSTLIVLYHIAVAGNLVNWFGIFIPSQSHRAVTLAVALILIYLLFDIKNKEKDFIKWYDVVLILSAVVSLGYVIMFPDNIVRYSMYGALDLKGMFLALMLWIPLLEALRRKIGWTLPIIILVLVGITVFQNVLPGILHGSGYPLERLLYSSYVGVRGIFGLPLGVASTILLIFLVFGALLQKAGAGKWFIDLAMAITGRSRGGPAKASVVSSAFFGSVSGSPSSNVATTGNITIPLMKQTGYRSSFAGATEAVASTGGQILPPIMGAIAFVMMEWLNVPYAQIAMAALIPALLYFFVAFMSVHFQACKTNVQPLKRNELPNLVKVFKEGWYYLLPLVVLVYFLVIKHLPPAVAGIYSLPVLIAISFLSKYKENHLNIKNIMEAFNTAVIRWLTVVVITASVGILVGALNLSGLGLKFSRFVIDISGENLILTLVLVGICALILGMGLDAIPAYITLATLLAPAIVALGVPEISAHLFVVYWGLASFITPPVCIAVYVAIGISGSSVWKTGWEAMKIGAAAYVIPFAFVLNPELMLMGDWQSIIFKVIIVSISCVFIASALQGYGFKSMNFMERIVLVIGALLMIYPSVYFLGVGLTISVLIYLRQIFSVKFSEKNIPNNQKTT